MVRGLQGVRKALFLYEEIEFKGISILNAGTDYHFSVYSISTDKSNTNEFL